VLKLRAELRPNLVQRSVTACVVMHEEGAVCLEHQHLAASGSLAVRRPV
jgi:hypothetical protein